MNLIEGRYYETAQGVTVGPMIEMKDSGGMTYFNSGEGGLRQLDSAGSELEEFQKWLPDGTIYAGVITEDGHILVKQVPAPGFTLEVGATYETADGETVGPLVDNSDGNIHWPFYFGEGVGKRMYYKPDGYSCPGMSHLHKDGQDLVHKLSPAPLKIEAGKKYVFQNGDTGVMKAVDGYFVANGMHYNANGVCGYMGTDSQPYPGFNVVAEHVEEANKEVELTITFETEAAQKLIDDAMKVFDEAAGNLLDKLAEKDEELRAAKEAFNILHREKVNLEIQVDVQGRSLNRKNKELNHYRAELSDAEDTIAIKTERVQRAFRLVESANARSARNNAVHKKNEALGFEILRLNERIHEIRYVANKFVADKKRGDIRLRDTRKRLKLEKERAKDAEDQLKGFTSGKAMVRNGLIVLNVVLMAFATGAFFLLIVT